MCYFLKMKYRTSREVTAVDIDLDPIHQLRDYKDWEESHEDPDPPTLTFRDWPRTIETLKEYLRECLGTTKIPLAYVIRDDIAVPNNVAIVYSTRQDELIARAPIQVMVGGVLTYTPVYMADRALVYEKIAALTRDHDCWTYVRPAQRTRDGRQAYLGLYGHYLGVNNVDNMATKAESKLMSLTYNGETRRWNFEKYVKMHVDQHHILDGLTQYGHAGIDQRSKVRHLIRGIKTKTLDTVKSQILSSATLRNDFDACVNLYQDYIAQTEPQGQRDVTIATLTTEKGKGKSKESWDKVQPDMSVEDRFYKPEEYNSLSMAKKKGLQIKRRKREGGRGEGKPRKKARFSNRELKKVAFQISKMTTDDKEDDDASNDSDSDKNQDKGPSNRTSKALVCKSR
jgi:hypothetical protein